MKNKKKKKKKTKVQKSKEKILLETSVQIGKITKKAVKDYVKSCYQTNNLYSSNFSKYEFKSGFIKSLINFYLLVKIYQDPSKALLEWSQKFSQRDLKNVLILQGLLQNINAQIDTKNITSYLAKIESIITWIDVNFDTELVSLVGDFCTDDVVRCDIFDSSKYENFINLINQRKDLIPLDEFWNKHKQELDNLTKDENSYKSKHKYIYNKLSEIKTDSINANKSTVNKGIGDAVIAVDMPITFTLATLDSSFDTLCPLIDKKHIKISSKKDSSEEVHSEAQISTPIPQPVSF